MAAFSNKPLSIVPVYLRDEKRRFFEMTRLVYRDMPSFVQPLTLERLDHLNPKRNPSVACLDVAYWNVYRGTDVVGRISGQINRAYNERYGTQTAHFGFFEAIDDREVVELLINTVEIWAKTKGAVNIQGPFSLTINDQAGLLIDGFESIPSLMMPHGQPFYDGMLKDLGYQKAKDLIAFDMDLTKPWNKKVKRIIDRLEKTSDLKIRQVSMKNFIEEIETICSIFNSAWQGNWGFLPFTSEEAQFMAKSIRPLINENCIAIAEYRGEAIAMSVTLPNINEFIQDMDGRLFPLNWLKLIWRLKVKGSKTWRMPLMGVRKEWQSTLVGAAASLGVINQVRTYHSSRGATRAELSWMLEDNKPILDIVKIIGTEPYKTYRVYERDLI